MIIAAHAATTLTERLEVIAVAVIICGLIFELVRRKRLMERYAILWLAAGVIVLVLGLWKGLLTRLSHVVGIYYAPTALFAVAFVFVLVMLVHFSIIVSRLSDQNTLLAEVDAAIGAFMTSISAGSRSNDVTMMVYSEFGRRVMSNASDGTDHGTSAPVLLIGNSVKGGLYGEQPPLNNLDVNGNLQVTTDFRSVYGGLLNDVLATPVSDVIPSWNTALSVH